MLNCTVINDKISQKRQNNMAADKKPVWVDKYAHTILKAYARSQGASMVDIASQLVLEQLNELSADAGLVSENEKLNSVIAPAVNRAKKKKRATQGKDVKFIGGVWLV